MIEVLFNDSICSACNYSETLEETYNLTCLIGALGEWLAHTLYRLHKIDHLTCTSP